MAEQVDDGGIVTSFTLTLLLTLVLVVIFLVLRRAMGHVYHPRRLSDHSSIKWLAKSLSASPKKLGSQGGLNAYLLTLLSTYFTFYFGLCGTLGLLLLLVPNLLDNDSDEAGLVKTTGSNLEKDSWKLYLPAFMAWVYTAVGTAMMFWYQRTFFKARAKFKGVDRYTIKIRHVPTSLGLDADALSHELTKFVNSLTGGAVVSVYCVFRQEPVLRLRKQKAALCDCLEACQQHLAKHGRRPMIRVGGALPCHFCGQRVDAIAHHEAALACAAREIAAAQQRTRDSDDFTGVAFITMNDTAAVSLMVREFSYSRKRHRLLSRVAHTTPLKPHRWTVTFCPPPQTIIWTNLDISLPRQAAQRALAWLVVVVLAFTWSVPISLLSSASRLARIPGAGVLVAWLVEQHETFRSLFETHFPVLLTTIFFASLPKLLKIICQHERHHSVLEQRMSVALKFYFFILLNIVIFQTVFTGASDFLSSILAGSRAEVNNPALSFQHMNYALQGAFYITYLFSAAMTSSAITLLLPGDLFRLAVKRWLVPYTPRQLNHLSRLHSFPFHIAFPFLLVHSAITLMFSVIVPLVVPVGFLAFFTRGIVNRNNILHVHARDEDDGTIVKHTLPLFFIGLILFHLTTLFFLRAKGAAGPMYAVLPLPFLALAAMAVMATLFYLDDKGALKAGAKCSNLATYEQSFLTAYQPPATVPEEKGDELVHPDDQLLDYYGERRKVRAP